MPKSKQPLVEWVDPAALGGPDAKALLEKALNDRDFSVSSAAERGLKEID